MYKNLIKMYKNLFKIYKDFSTFFNIYKIYMYLFFKVNNDGTKVN